MTPWYVLTSSQGEPLEDEHGRGYLYTRDHEARDAARPLAALIKEIDPDAAEELEEAGGIAKDTEERRADLESAWVDLLGRKVYDASAVDELADFARRNVNEERYDELRAALEAAFETELDHEDWLAFLKGKTA